MRSTLLGHTIRVISSIRVSEEVYCPQPKGLTTRLLLGQKYAKCGEVADFATITLRDQAKRRRSQRFRDHPRRESGLADQEVSP